MKFHEEVEVFREDGDTCETRVPVVSQVDTKMESKFQRICKRGTTCTQFCEMGLTPRKINDGMWDGAHLYFQPDS